MLNYEFFIAMSIYEARILFIQTLGKYISATFNLDNKTAQTFAHIFLWTAHCKSELELLGQQKVMKETVAEDTLFGRQLVEKLVNKKTVLEGAVNQ